MKMNKLHKKLAKELELQLKKDYGSATAVKNEIKQRLVDDLYDMLADDDSGELATQLVEIQENGWKFKPWNKMNTGELCLEYVNNNVDSRLNKKMYQSEKEMLFENFEDIGEAQTIMMMEEIADGLY